VRRRWRLFFFDAGQHHCHILKPISSPLLELDGQGLFSTLSCGKEQMRREAGETPNSGAKICLNFCSNKDQ
jgi:hypothetical protein